MIAIVPSPTALVKWAGSWWPHYPLARMEPYSDGVLTMSYWAGHKAKHQTTAVGEVESDVARVRAAVTDRQMPIHVAGSPTTVSDIRGFAAAALRLKIVGGSVYDFQTTDKTLFPALRGLRVLRV